MSRRSLLPYTKSYSLAPAKLLLPLSFCPFAFCKDPHEHMSETSGSSPGQKAAPCLCLSQEGFHEVAMPELLLSKAVQVLAPPFALYYYEPLLSPPPRLGITILRLEMIFTSSQSITRPLCSMHHQDPFPNWLLYFAGWHLKATSPTLESEWEAPGSPL